MVVSVVKTFDSNTSIRSFNRFEFRNAGNLIFFTDFSSNNDGLDSIWRSDGPESGTFEILLNEGDFPGTAVVPFESTEGKIFFPLEEDVNGTELWVNDGTVEGSSIVKDIATEGSSNPRVFFGLNDKLFFTADDDVNGRELWVSDGTESGTLLLQDFTEGTGSSDFEDFIDFNGTLFFQRGTSNNRERALWKSDGTPEGTELVKEFEDNRDLGAFTVVGDTLFFTRDTVGELWKTDGTTEGTVLVAEGLDGIDEAVAVGDTLFFDANSEDLVGELWRSDGTPEGTQVVRDIRPEEPRAGATINEGSFPSYLIEVNGTLFFTADDGVNGRELWRSDGTEAGTQLFRDFTEGDNSLSNLSQFNSIEGTLFFLRSTESSSEVELWQSDGTEEGTLRIEPDQVNVGGGGLIDSFQLSNSDQLIELNDQLYFTGEAFSFAAGDYLPALLTLS